MCISLSVNNAMYVYDLAEVSNTKKNCDNCTQPYMSSIVFWYPAVAVIDRLYSYVKFNSRPCLSDVDSIKNKADV